MAIYIVTAEPREQFNYLGESLGMSGKRALFYLPEIGKRRAYRNDMTKPQKGLKLFTFKDKSLAQIWCGTTNDRDGADWKVEQVQEVSLETKVHQILNH